MGNFIELVYEDDDFDDIYQLVDDVDDNDGNERQWGGPRPGKSANINCDCAPGAQIYFRRILQPEPHLP